MILLDEPFAAVDPKTTEDIRSNIRDLAKSGIGILLTDHNVREVLKITDRSYLIKDGQVVTAGTPQQLIHDPIAINEYLGTTFTDNTFGGQPLPQSPQPATVQPVAAPSFGIQQLLEQEKMRSLVERLRHNDTLRAAQEELIGEAQRRCRFWSKRWNDEEIDAARSRFRVVETHGGQPD